MGPRMGPNRMPLLGDLADYFGMLSGQFPNHKKGGFCTLRGERSQNRLRGARHRTIVEGEHNLARRQQVAIAVRRAEPGSTACLDLDNPRNAKRVRFWALWLCFCRHC